MLRKISKRNRQDKLPAFANCLIILFFILVAIICIYPVLLVIGISLSSEESILANGYKLIPSVFTTEAYSYVFRSGQAIGRAYLLTLFVTVVGTIASTLVIAMFAYPLSRKDFRYKKFFTVFITITMLFSGGMVPWYMVCVQILHINNTIFALILPNLISAWYVIIMRTFFQTSIPDALIESAQIDGSSDFNTFLKIVLPLSLPGLATIGLFNTLLYWNDWWLPLMLVTDSKLYNMQFLLYKMINNIEYLNQISTTVNVTNQLESLPSESARMAMCVLSIGPIILAYPFFQKYFIKGLTVGSIKG